MAHKFTFRTYLLRGPTEREYEIDVTYSVTTGRPAILYGDYPQPAEDGEVEILKVEHNGRLFDTTADEDDILHTQACERADDDLACEAADADEYRADMRRDAREAA